MIIYDIICKIKGHYGEVDPRINLGTCSRCVWLFRVTIDKATGAVTWGNKIDCNCIVLPGYGFMPETGCPLHD